jgi:hypothetical protein
VEDREQVPRPHARRRHAEETAGRAAGRKAPYQASLSRSTTRVDADGRISSPRIGGNTLDDIPFVFIGANDLVPEPEIRRCSACRISRSRSIAARPTTAQTLFYAGPAHACHHRRQRQRSRRSRTARRQQGRHRPQASAATRSTSASRAAGLGEMRQSLNDDKKRAARWASPSWMSATRSRRIGRGAAHSRVAARTTTISSVAQCAGAGLSRRSSYCAEWVGEDPDEVSVEPTTDFADQTVAGAALLAFMQAKQLGLPLSLARCTA